MYDVESVRKEFPILHREVYGKPLVYLDNGASAQKPLAVIETINRVYREEYANVHRGLHFLSNTATEAYEGVRGKIAKFVGATHEEEIVYVRSSTEAINLVAYSWLEPRVQPGDDNRTVRNGTSCKYRSLALHAGTTRSGAEMGGN